MFVITDNIMGFNYYIQELKTKLYGNINPEWTGLVENAKKFPDKESASIYMSKYHLTGEVKKVKSR